MKRLIAFILILTMSVGAFAQSAMLPATDTITNADTANLALRIPGSNNVLTFQLNVTKLTGTTAGSAYVQGSLDGVNYFTLAGTDTLTMANSNNYKAWVVSRSNFVYYRIRVIGSGSQSTQIKGYALFRE